MTVISTEEVQKDIVNLLSRLEGGEAFLIASGGKPLGRLEPVAATRLEGGEEQRARTFPTLAERLRVPDDFNEMMREEIEELFYGRP